MLSGNISDSLSVPHSQGVGVIKSLLSSLCYLVCCLLIMSAVLCLFYIVCVIVLVLSGLCYSDCTITALVPCVCYHVCYIQQSQDQDVFHQICHHPPLPLTRSVCPLHNLSVPGQSRAPTAYLAIYLDTRIPSVSAGLSLGLHQCNAAGLEGVKCFME